MTQKLHEFQITFILADDDVERCKNRDEKFTNTLARLLAEMVSRNVRDGQVITESAGREQQVSDALEEASQLNPRDIH